MRSLLIKIIFCLAATGFFIVLSSAVILFFHILSSNSGIALQPDNVSVVFNLKNAWQVAIPGLALSVWAVFRLDDTILSKFLRFFLILGTLITGLTYIVLKSAL